MPEMEREFVDPLIIVTRLPPPLVTFGRYLIRKPNLPYEGNRESGDNARERTGSCFGEVKG
jgi:hypothetical protein